jgi:hypothetical protein
MDYSIELPEGIRFVGHVFGCVYVRQISGYGVLGPWHFLLCVAGAFSIARM